MHRDVTRRTFLRGAALAGSGLVILSNSRLVRGTQANSKLNIAAIGI
ncbi:MAG: twin-arginine translocation signal domain-containing protein, partial [Nocardiaceae bacterium]|nr:twin-arginine translocation signal domain-containing protein [Nocardiaceae bacterium]